MDEKAVSGQRSAVSGQRSAVSGQRMNIKAMILIGEIKLRDFKSLAVWEKAHQLTCELYSLTKLFPKEELYGLTSQMRRACVSITANIAEGCGKRTEAEFARYLQISIGSASELEYYFILAKDLKYIDSVISVQCEQKT